MEFENLIMASLPESRKISTVRLANVFNNTSATYKFYWFISMLEIYGKNQSSCITFDEILTRMIANAWYPIHYFRLSFGLQDKLSDSIKEIQTITNIPIDANKDVIQKMLLSNTDKRVRSLISNFSLNVPYRFLSPWIPYTSDINVINQSANFTDDCPYRIINKHEKCIVVNDNWKDYLLNNYRILLDYTYWNLTMYLQNKNPNVPDLANKLIKPISRNSLSSQRSYWEIVFDKQQEFECIYTGLKLTKANYDLEHFIPWSFVSHDLQWNLLPSDKSINCSKSNKLPSLELYLTKFVETQKRGLEIVFNAQPNHKRLEDFTMFGYSASDLSKMPLYNFKELYYKTMSPMVQIAENMGFEKWNRII